METGQRVEVLWTRGMADEWLTGTVLERGRVRLDDWHLYVPEPPFILEAEEIATVRMAPLRSAGLI